MPIIKLETVVDAPIETVFDLARSIDLHSHSLAHTGEKPIAGVTKGLINLGETVTWEATHFGVRQNLTSKITLFDRPRHFRDSMIAGAFTRFDHDHYFEDFKAQTLMTDVFDYDSPLGVFGKFADWLFLEKYMTHLLTDRNQAVKRAAENDEWRKYLA